MRGEPLIVLDAVSKRHGEGPAAVAALAGVNLAVHQGERLAVVGPSGLRDGRIVSDGEPVGEHAGPRRATSP